MIDLDDEDEAAAVPLWRRRHVRYIALAVGGVIALVFLRGTPQPKQDEPEKTTQAYIGEVVPYQPAQAEPSDPIPPPPPAPQAAQPPPTARTLSPEPPATQPPQPPALPRMLAPTGTAATKPPAPTRPPMLSFSVPHTDGPKATAAAPAEPPQTRVAFKASDLPGVKASPAIDDTYQLAPGLLPCVLDTAIQSDLPGPIQCHLPGPVYSRKGVLLMEAETQVWGAYQSMGKAGVNRLEATSLMAKTPNGIWVPLAGQPLSDDLGRAGLDGAVDNHYLQRFGGAVLLTLTESALGIVQSAMSKGGNTYLSLSGGGGSGVGGLAQQILQSQINIAPTFSKHAGETIAIWLTKPIDFSDSYKIREIR